MADIKIGDISVYKDDDGKAVWEFEGKVQSDIPLDTDAQDFAGAINELKKLSEAGGGDDWQPPDWWIPVPEPDDYEIYMLVWAGKSVYNGMRTGIQLYKERDGYPGSYVVGDNIYCDWGDGESGTYSANTIHNYTEPGQYLVHIVGNEKAKIFSGSNLSGNLLIFKSGSEIVCNKGFHLFGSQTSLAYIKIYSPDGITGVSGGIGQNKETFTNCNSLKKLIIQNKTGVTNIGKGVFNNCRALEQVNFENCKIIGEQVFYGCSSVKTISFPNVTRVGASAFSGCYCLRSVYLPNCTSIGDQAFYQCYNLQEIIIAENCTFGTNCFQGCYSLYPRPDGSIN